MGATFRREQSFIEAVRLVAGDRDYLWIKETNGEVSHRRLVQLTMYHKMRHFSIPTDRNGTRLVFLSQKMKGDCYAIAVDDAVELAAELSYLCFPDKAFRAGGNVLKF